MLGGSSHYIYAIPCNMQIRMEALFSLFIGHYSSMQSGFLKTA